MSPARCSIRTGWSGSGGYPGLPRRVRDVSRLGACHGQGPAHRTDHSQSNGCLWVRSPGQLACKFETCPVWGAILRGSTLKTGVIQIARPTRFRSALSTGPGGTRNQLPLRRRSQNVTRQAARFRPPSARFSNQRAEGSFGQFAVVGNGETVVRRFNSPEDDVAPVLFIELVTDCSKKP